MQSEREKDAIGIGYVDEGEPSLFVIRLGRVLLVCAISFLEMVFRLKKGSFCLEGLKKYRLFIIVRLSGVGDIQCLFVICDINRENIYIRKILDIVRILILRIRRYNCEYIYEICR
jgi:hypothetical protein